MSSLSLFRLITGLAVSAAGIAALVPLSAALLLRGENTHLLIVCAVLILIFAIMLSLFASELADRRRQAFIAKHPEFAGLFAKKEDTADFRRFVRAVRACDNGKYGRALALADKIDLSSAEESERIALESLRGFAQAGAAR